MLQVSHTNHLVIKATQIDREGTETDDNRNRDEDRDTGTQRTIETN